VASTSSARTSRIALVYSVRFSRCMPGGIRFAEPLRSSSVSMKETIDSSTGAAGRGMPAGGIIPARSLRTTFSQVSAWSCILATSSLSSNSPAVCKRWLWQVTQYWSSSARAEAAEATGVAGAACCERAICRYPGTATIASPAASRRRLFRCEFCCFARGRRNPLMPLLIRPPYDRRLREALATSKSR
jgi:hypothetical protein